MEGKDRTTLITEMAAPLAASLGLSVWGVEFVGAGRPTLRLFVEKQPDAAGAPAAEAVPPQAGRPAEGALAQDGVSVEQCAELSRLLGLALDVEETFSGAWVLEVSSPGLERVFFRPEQLAPYLGRELDVALAAAHPAWPAVAGLPGRKKFCGPLLAVDGDRFTLAIPSQTRLPEDPETVTITWADVRRAHLVHVFPEPGLPKKGGKATQKAPKGGGNA